MLKAVVFDLDETLLSLNLAAFLAVLIKDEAGLLAQIGRKNQLSMLAVYSAALFGLNNAARAEDDRRTNRAYFDDAIQERCGIPLADPLIADAFTTYERDILPTRNDAIIAARPQPGAREALEAVRSRGLRIALFTNPCFTRTCVEVRLGWAGLADVPFERVTTMENSTRCKPAARYYTEALDALGLTPAETLMVGNDPKRDFAAPDIGLQTAYVGQGPAPVRATWAGDMASFAASLPEIEERFAERQERRLLDLVQDTAR